MRLRSGLLRMPYERASAASASRAETVSQGCALHIWSMRLPSALLHVLCERVSAAGASRAEPASQGCALHIWSMRSRPPVLGRSGNLHGGHPLLLRIRWFVCPHFGHRRVPSGPVMRKCRVVECRCKLIDGRPEKRTRCERGLVLALDHPAARSLREGRLLLVSASHRCITKGRPVTDHPTATKFNKPRDIAGPQAPSALPPISVVWGRGRQGTAATACCS